MLDEPKDIRASTADAKQGDTSPPAAKLEFTTAEFEAKVADEVAKRTALHQTTVADLSAKLKHAQGMTDDEKRASTLKESYVIRYKMPEEIAETFAGITDVERREKNIATWLANTPAPVNAEALASADAKIKGRAADQKILDLGNSGSAPKAGMTWDQAQRSTDLDAVRANYQRLIKQ